MANNKKLNSTNSFVEVSEIRDSVLIMKNGSLRSVIEVGSTNFALKSEDEQIAITSAFANFLNALDFPIQIRISSRKLNIDKYLESLDAKVKDTPGELLKIQLVEYIRFVRGLTDLADIMSKKFYITIPYYIVATAESYSGASIMKSLKSVFKPSEFIKGLNEKEFLSYKTQLEQRIDLVMSNVLGMGLKAKLLDDDELYALLDFAYNPDLKSKLENIMFD